MNVQGGNAALPGQQHAAAATQGNTMARPAAPAAPLRIGGTRRVAAPAARPALPAPDIDLRTLPMMLTPPARPPVRQPVPAPVPAAARSRRRPTLRGRTKEYVEHVNPVQLVCWQVAAIAVLLSLQKPWLVIVAASASAAVLLALTSVRLGGRWLYELAVLAAAYFARTRRRDLPEGSGKSLALLAMLLPGASIRTVETSHGAALAISHHGGLTALVKPRDVSPQLLNTLPAPAGLLPPPDGQHRFAVQQVFHVGVRPDRPRRLWLAVHATRTAETPGDDELTLALRNGLRRVRGALARAGIPTDPLAEEAALATIAGLTHVTGGRNEVREDWRFWRTGPVSQTAFELTGWDRLADTHARQLIGLLLAGIPGVAATVTLGARGGARGGAVLRLASTTEAAVETAARTLTDRLTPSGVRLARLDGAHLSGVAASLPIGVFR